MNSYISAGLIMLGIWATLVVTTIAGMAQHIAWAITTQNWFWGVFGFLLSPVGVINGLGRLLGLWG